MLCVSWMAIFNLNKKKNFMFIGNVSLVLMEGHEERAIVVVLGDDGQIGRDTHDPHDQDDIRVSQLAQHIDLVLKFV